jgi:hypothetical protein
VAGICSRYIKMYHYRDTAAMPTTFIYIVDMRLMVLDGIMEALSATNVLSLLYAIHVILCISIFCNQGMNSGKAHTDYLHVESQADILIYITETKVIFNVLLCTVCTLNHHANPLVCNPTRNLVCNKGLVFSCASKSRPKERRARSVRLAIAWNPVFQFG